jgi:hypothetical protein
VPGQEKEKQAGGRDLKRAADPDGAAQLQQVGEGKLDADGA